MKDIFTTILVIILMIGSIILTIQGETLEAIHLVVLAIFLRMKD